MPKQTPRDREDQRLERIIDKTKDLPRLPSGAPGPHKPAPNTEGQSVKTVPGGRGDGN